MDAKTASQHNNENGSTVASHTFVGEPKVVNAGPVRVQSGKRNPKVQKRNNVEWQTVKVFDDAITGLAVGVQKLSLRQPKFSLVVGSIGGDDYMGVKRFIKPAVHVENAKVTVAYDGMTLARLFDQAMLYIGEQLQATEDSRILWMQQREQRSMEQTSGGQKKQHGLSKFTDGSKTVREAGKRVQHENNLAARRSADQERTSNSKRGK